MDDENSINILQSISNEEKGHIELAKKLLKITGEDLPKKQIVYNKDDWLPFLVK